MFLVLALKLRSPQRQISHECADWSRGMAGARRLVAHDFARHQWAHLPAHKESGARGCAQRESPSSEAPLSSLLLGSILWSVMRGGRGAVSSSGSSFSPWLWDLPRWQRLPSETEQRAASSFGLVRVAPRDVWHQTTRLTDCGITTKAV